MKYPRLRYPAPLLAVLLVGLATSVAVADEPTSENNPRLAGWLEDFPEADANRDGVLTRTEALAYRDRRRAEQGRAAAARRGKSDSLKPTAADVRYGEHPRNLLDFYRSESTEPTPVLIYFHGGGFVGGDKGFPATRGLLGQCLENGISVVSANYRFVAGRDSEPFPGPMNDGARVIQFVRTKAGPWNLDAKRIALCGGSAGACMSMWLAMHDDLADPNSDDAVARQSTRVSCVVTYGGQSSLDPEWIVANIGGNPGVHPSLLPFYGVSAVGDLAEPKCRELIRRASPITHASKDDPPMYLVYSTPLEGTPLPPETPVGTSIHHALFGKLVDDRYEELGIECQVRYRGHMPTQKELEFLKKHLE